MTEYERLKEQTIIIFVCNIAGRLKVTTSVASQQL